jgi:hypothetical protein
MKKFFYLILIITGTAFGQIDLSAGMGINFTSFASLNDYISSVNNQDLASFNSNVEFFGEAGYLLKNNFMLGLDYSFSLYSYTNDFYGLGKFKFEYNLHSPTLMAYYVLKGEGYKFKLGGGAGIRYIVCDQTLPQSTLTETYSSTGFGALLKAEGNTALGQNVFALIAFALKMDFPGTPKSSGKPLSYRQSGINDVDINSFTAGVRLGILYTF